MERWKMPKTIVELDGVTRRFDLQGEEVAALVNARCAVREGDEIAVMGPSGSGKSTLLALMAQLDEPSQGKITWPLFAKGEKLRPRHIGLAFQSPSLIPALSIAENVEMPLLILGDRVNMRQRALQALELVGLAHLADRLPEEISGGQAQRAAVARALVTEPQLILADEPTGQLDQVTGQSLIATLQGFARRTGAALVIATHDEAVARQMKSIWHTSHGALSVNDNIRMAS
jgi:ABC-type lipoprotein export system ATPase subunit